MYTCPAAAFFYLADSVGRAGECVLGVGRWVEQPGTRRICAVESISVDLLLDVACKESWKVIYKRTLPKLSTRLVPCCDMLMLYQQEYGLCTHPARKSGCNILEGKDSRR